MGSDEKYGGFVGAHMHVGPGDPGYVTTYEALRRDLAIRAECVKGPTIHGHSHDVADHLARVSKVRQKMKKRGEIEGPPNPYRPHRKP